MGKLKGLNKEDFLAKKRERERIRYQLIKNNPELYVEYQRKNKLKYENRKVQRKIVSINEMTSSQQKIQRKKWREERKKRYQRIKDKKHNAKPENTVFTTNIESEDTSYININNNSELNFDEQREYERNTQQNAIVAIKETLSCLHKTQSKKQRKGTYPHTKDKKDELKSDKDDCKAEDIDFFTVKTEKEDLSEQNINSNPEFNLDVKTEYEWIKPQNTVIFVKETLYCQQSIQSGKLQQETKGRYEETKNKIDKHENKSKPGNREQVLAKKRERGKLRYQNIRNNPELYAEYQRKNKLKYEKMKAQKKILLINEMTPRQQKKEREKWRAARKKRYHRLKNKKASETENMAKNNPTESDIYSVQLLVIRKTKNLKCEL